jgi:uncharacterized RDD family membrane protein YckC
VSQPPPPPPPTPPPPPPPGGAPLVAPYQPAQNTPLPPGVEVSSAGKRLGGFVLEVVLVIVTLFIGWLIWSLVVWGQSTSPGKQLLKMKVLKKETGLRASYGTMVLREVVGKWLIVEIVIGSICGIAALVLDFMLLWDQDRQQLWDKIAGTIVVDDPNGVITKDLPAG